MHHSRRTISNKQRICSYDASIEQKARPPLERSGFDGFISAWPPPGWPGPSDCLSPFECPQYCQDQVYNKSLSTFAAGGYTCHDGLSRYRIVGFPISKASITILGRGSGHSGRLTGPHFLIHFLSQSLLLQRRFNCDPRCRSRWLVPKRSAGSVFISIPASIPGTSALSPTG
jgi:hypothetical protein